MRVLLALGILALCTACDGPPPPDSGLDVARALGGEADAGYARAIAPRDFAFPADHNAHPDFRNEWWYVTGQLESGAGERFGYQVTFFRIALAPDEPEADSAWATRQVWMAHTALTEIDREEHHHEARLARGAVGLAGQTSQPFRVWLEDWSLSGEPGGGFPWQIDVATDEFALELTLTPERPPLLQGREGLSQKSAEPGNASYYYSITRLATTGQISSGEETMPVTGLSWLDREWSTSALGVDQEGWDWFSLHLDSGDDLMLYRLRTRDGQADPHSAGKLLFDDAQVLSLDADAFRLEPLRWWTSPLGVRYPVAWRVEVPSAKLDVQVQAALDDQEMDTGILYWEGAVEVYDEHGRVRLGTGYLEMTGYDAADRK